jgi:hypothetical protein
VAIVAFSLEALGLLLLLTQIRGPGDLVDLLAMASVLALAGHHWFRRANYQRALFFMELQYVFGIYFLI